MANKTQHYNLNKPLETEAYNIAVFNENADLIDSALEALANLIAVGALTKERVLNAIDQAIIDGDVVNANRLNGKSSGEFATSTQGARADALVEGTTPAGNASKLGGQLPAHYAKQSSTYTKTEVDNAISQVVTDLDWKESVSTFADLATTYPHPQDGWTVNVKDTDVTYRWSGSKWIAISANAIPKATTSVDGLMTKEQVSQLNATLPATSQAADSAKLGGKLPAEFASSGHTHDKDQVGLGNLSNWSAATISEILAGTTQRYAPASAVKGALDRYLPRAGGKMEGNLNMDGKTLILKTGKFAVLLGNNESNVLLWDFEKSKGYKLNSDYNYIKHGTVVPTTLEPGEVFIQY